MVDQKFAVSLHIMAALAHAGCKKGLLLTSSELSKSVRTNPTVVRRLVARLAESGLVKAYKGKAGGIELTRTPDKISLGDIYKAVVQKTLLQRPDKAPRRQCAVSCAMGEVMVRLIDGFEKNSLSYFNSIRLSQIISEIENN